MPRRKTTQPLPAESLIGRGWTAIINGRRSLNGKRYSITLHGTVDNAEGDETLFDVLGQLSDHIEEQTCEMEYPDSIQITIFPPES